MGIPPWITAGWETVRGIVETTVNQWLLFSSVFHPSSFLPFLFLYMQPPPCIFFLSHSLPISLPPPPFLPFSLSSFPPLPPFFPTSPSFLFSLPSFSPSLLHCLPLFPPPSPPLLPPSPPLLPLPPSFLSFLSPPSSFLPTSLLIL